MSEFIQNILTSVNQLLSSRNRDALDQLTVLFALEEDVDYQVTVKVRKTYDLEGIEERIKEVMQQGPSWVHANLLCDETGTYIIALKFGALVGNPNPTINVSFEL